MHTIAPAFKPGFMQKISFGFSRYMMAKAGLYIYLIPFLKQGAISDLFIFLSEQKTNIYYYI